MIKPVCFQLYTTNQYAGMRQCSTKHATKLLSFTKYLPVVILPNILNILNKSHHSTPGSLILLRLYLFHRQALKAMQQEHFNLSP